ncbi:hypothetical protein FKM82_023244 [Ascaphus truei]
MAAVGRTSQEAKRPPSWRRQSCASTDRYLEATGRAEILREEGNKHGGSRTRAESPSGSQGGRWRSRPCLTDWGYIGLEGQYRGSGVCPTGLTTCNISHVPLCKLLHCS